MRAAARQVLRHWIEAELGNSSGVHRAARQAKAALEDARYSLASVVGCDPGEVVFTSGGTEADNLAIGGVTDAVGGRPACSAIEHHAVLDPVLHRGGIIIEVGPDGVLAPDAALAAIDENPAEISLLSVMTANNETGILQPVTDIAAAVRSRRHDLIVHTDAVQAFGWVDLVPIWETVDLMSISGHKFGGPQGVGALIVKAGTPLRAQVLGGGQERERRSGTHNVAGIAAMVAAAEEAEADREVSVARVRALRDRLVAEVTHKIDDVSVTGVIDGHHPPRLPHLAHFCFRGVESEALLFLLERKDVYAAAASSCASGAMEPSHVLMAMGHSRTDAFGSLRLSLGHQSTDADVDAAVAALIDAVARLRERG